MQKQVSPITVISLIFVIYYALSIASLYSTYSVCTVTSLQWVICFYVVTVIAKLMHSIWFCYRFGNETIDGAWAGVGFIGSQFLIRIVSLPIKLVLMSLSLYNFSSFATDTKGYLVTANILALVDLAISGLIIYALIQK